jgi:hypothetical protein
MEELMPFVQAMLRSGAIGNADRVASVHVGVKDEEPGRGARVIDIRMLGGFSLRVLPDRGLDIGEAWVDGVPVAWTSRVGESALGNVGDLQWLLNFGGGLLVTCGMQNVGPASEGHGLHGLFSNTPARDVSVARQVDETGVSVRVHGVIVEGDALEGWLECDRTITITCGRPSVRWTDRVTNRGPRTVPAPILYHINIGAPLWFPGADLRVPSTRVLPRDDASVALAESWDRAPVPSPEADEMVVEHVISGADAARVVTIDNPTVGLRVSVEWDARVLPRLHQWVHCRQGIYALGIEPANCSVRGRAWDREKGDLPVLHPGEERVTWVTLAAIRLPATPTSH